MLARFFDTSLVERSHPLLAFDGFRREMDWLFADLERGAGVPSERTFTFRDTGEGFVLSAELPGVSEDDLKVEVSAGLLRISVARDLEVPAGYQTRRRERRAFQVSRAFRLPAAADTDSAQAELRNGVLTLTVPKTAKPAPRKIPVKAA